MGLTRPYPGGVTNSRWGKTSTVVTASGCSPDPADNRVCYARVTKAEKWRALTGTRLEGRNIKPASRATTKRNYAFNCETRPIHMSPNEKGTIYIGRAISSSAPR